jgi:hypothetical protein
MVGRVSVVVLIEEGVRALSRSDAEQLGVLADEAQGAVLPRTDPERAMAKARLRVLGNLLALTRHNLRLLRCVASENR